MLSVGIVGSRDYPNLAEVAVFVDTLGAGVTVVSGGARGVDSAAAKAVREHSLCKLVEYRVAGTGPFHVEKWDLEGRVATISYKASARTWPSFGQAAFARNQYIVEDADVIAAFWDGESPGTANTIRLARQAGKVVLVTT